MAKAKGPSTPKRKPPQKSPKRKKIAPPTPRERKLMVLLPTCKTYQEALIQAGYSESTAKHYAKKTIDTALVKTSNQQSFQKALEKIGINDELIALKHLEGLEAYKVISAVIQKSGKQGDADGGTHDFVEVPDFPARHKHVDTLHKIRGDYAPTELNLNDGSGFAGMLAESLNRSAKTRKDAE